MAAQTFTPHSPIFVRLDRLILEVVWSGRQNKAARTFEVSPSAVEGVEGFSRKWT